MKIFWTQLNKNVSVEDSFLWLISVNIFTKESIRYDAGSSILDSLQALNEHLEQSFT